MNTDPANNLTLVVQYKFEIFFLQFPREILTPPQMSRSIHSDSCIKIKNTNLTQYFSC